MEKPVVIIAGASRGLGAAAAIEAALLGARVVISARSQGALEEIARKVRDEGGEALPVCCDVTHFHDNETVIAEAVKHYGRIDGLVNNMGVVEPIATIAEGDPSSWMDNLAVNLVGPMMMIQYALPYLKQVNGRVINVSSGAAERPFHGWGAYCSAKAGLNMMTRVLAQEEPEITVMAVKPGVVDTAMQGKIRAEGKGPMTETLHAYFVALHENGKLLPPEVPARAIVTLALRARHEWTGECIQWNDERVQSLF